MNRIAPLFLALLLLSPALAQTDVTRFFLDNYAFDSQFDYTSGQTVNVAQEIKEIPGWTPGFTVNYTISGIYEFGFKGTFNGASVPACGYDGESGGGLALSSGWEQDFPYIQDVTLPAGSYVVYAPAYNGSTIAAGTSLLAWMPDGGTAVKSEVNTFAVKAWTPDMISFTLPKTTSGKIRIGLKAAPNGSANTAKIIIDYVKIVGTDMNVKPMLDDAIATAQTFYGDGTGTGASSLAEAIARAQALAGASHTSDADILEAINALNDAVSEFRKHNISEDNPLDMTSYIVNPSFESNGLNGWIVSGLSTQSNAEFKKKKGAVYAEKWVSSGNSVGDASATQKITLPVGKYRLVAGAQNLNQSNTSMKCTGAYIFADQQHTPVYTPDDYTVDFTNVTGSVEIGFIASNAGGNWLAIDNFRLYQIGYVDTQQMLDELETLIDEATALLSQPMAQSSLDSLANAIDVAKTVVAERNDNAVAKAYDDLTVAIENAKKAIEWAEFVYNVNHPTQGTGTPVKVLSTNHYVPTGATEALMRATFSGSDIMERGVCWSTDHAPTVLDSRTTAYWTLNGNIYHITGLKSATVYYLRPYVLNKTYEVAYGDEVKIVTLPKGTCTGSWDEGAPSSDANARCRDAIRETIEYFNEWTGIKGFNLSGHYGADTPTADCSYGGWMRIGPNAGNQAIGTVIHETGHGVGVGTQARWSDANVHDWTWKGRETTTMYQFLENKMGNVNYCMVGDAQHGWGQNATYDWFVNGSDKDKHLPLQYAGGCMLLHSLFIDGLCPTSAYPNGISGYTYNFDSSKKYYLMCKDSERGLGDGLLFVRSNVSVGWKPMLSALDVISDSAAWYIDYNPVECHYTFRNAALPERYLTHSATGTFVTLKSIASTAQPSPTEYFQLMPDRTDVTIGKGSKAVKTHGYWFTWSDKGQNKSMSATNAFSESLKCGTIAQAGFDYSDAATKQQWIIISEDELDAYRQAAVSTSIQEIHAGGSAVPRKSSAAYNLAGQRVGDNYRGIVIVNGKKIAKK